MEFNKKLIVFFPIIAGILWGSGGVFVRILYNFGFGNVSIFSSRVILATILLFIILLIFDRKSLEIDLKDIWIFIGTGLIATLLSNIFYNESTFYVSLSFASLLVGFSPVFALIISVILFKEKLSLNKVICLIIAFFGCLLVSGILETSSGFKWSSWGVLTGLIAALSWAVYGIFSKIAFDKKYSTFTIMFYSFLLCSIFLAPISQWDLFGTFIKTNITYSTIFLFVYAVFTVIVPYFFFSFALKYMDNGEATILYGGSEPIAATILGALIFAEYPSILNLIGIIITIIALSLLVKSTDMN